MKILHIFDHSVPLHSGYAFRSQSILKAQRARGWETIHLTSPKQGPTKLLVEDIEGLRFYRTLQDRRWTSRFELAELYLLMRATTDRLNQVIALERPDILHAHSPILNAFPALNAGRRHNLPVVYEMRASWEDAAVDHGTARAGGLRYLASRHLETLAMKRSHAVTTICEGLREDVVGRGIASEKVTVIPNAVDLDQFSAGRAANPDLIQRYGLADSTVLGFIGSFYAYEGLDLLLEAMALLGDEEPRLKLMLVGGGPAEEALRKAARELDLGSKVIFTGRLPHDQINEFYNLIDVLVYPRIAIRLTELVTPLKPLEAMASARVVMASDVGGHRELIRDGKTGFLFPAGNPKHLAMSILDVLRRRDRWDEVRMAGRRFVETERTWTNSVSRYAPIYSALTQLR
jgi:PEP-CTERM/exosortase A-associated glycosyltransferase